MSSAGSPTETEIVENPTISVGTPSVENLKQTKEDKTVIPDTTDSEALMSDQVGTSSGITRVLPTCDK